MSRVSNAIMNLFTAIVLVCTIRFLTEAQQYPFRDPSLPWDKRVDDLVGRLLFDELVNQSATVSSQKPPPIDRLGIKPYQWDTECIRGIVGQNATAFPQSLGLSAAFSRALIYNMSVAVAHEVRAFYNDDVNHGLFGQHGLSCFSPVINIMRHPLWGRNQETYGEDPYLAGQLVSQYVQGLQGSHPRYVRANAGCKHFAVYAGPENIPSSRFSLDVKISERDLRMTFLPQFEECVAAGTYSVMCSYSSINGVPACANKKLLTDILRKEWNFQGYVVSDDDALLFAVTGHHYFPSNVEAAAGSINSGCNLELSDASRDWAFASIPQAISKGLLTKETLSSSLKPLFYTRMRLGEFDPPSMNPYSTINMSVVLSREHQELAIRAAMMSFVLLKNLNDYLPFKTGVSHLAVVGPFADNADLLFGDYAATPDRRFTTTPLQGLSRLSSDTRHAAGCSDPACLQYNHDEIKQAVVGANFVIVCLGLGVSIESEGNDRSELDLPGNQLQLLKDAIFYSRETPLVLLVFNAGPVDLTFAQENPDVNVIIACGYPGQATGEALYRVLTNSDGPLSVPAARLPATWPAQLNQIAPITDYNMTDGQTYRYLNVDPLYPFGFGLSYCQFHYSNLVLSPTTIKPGQNVTVMISVTNSGPFEADEVVQVYLAWTKSAVPVPRWTLVGFERVTLPVAVPQTVNFTITARQMAVWLDEMAEFVVQPGDMIIYAGGQQPFQRVNIGSNVEQATFTVAS